VTAAVCIGDSVSIPTDLGGVQGFIAFRQLERIRKTISIEIFGSACANAEVVATSYLANEL
jgi:hypothetical protein